MKGAQYDHRYSCFYVNLLFVHTFFFLGAPKRLGDCTPLRTVAQLLFQATVKIKHKTYFEFFAYRSQNHVVQQCNKVKKWTEEPHGRSHFLKTA